MDEKDIFMSGEDSVFESDTTRPEPEPQQDDTEALEQKAAQERLEQILKHVSVGKAEPAKEEKQEEVLAEPTEESPEEAPEEMNESAPKEIELMTVRKMTAAQKRAAVKKKETAKKKARNKKIAKKLLAALLIIALVMVGGGLYTDYMPNKQSGEVVITIPEGAGTADIAEILKQENLIASELFFRVMSKVRGVDGEYNCGKFKISKSAGYEEIFDVLTHAGQNVDAKKITIPEGYEIYKIADLLEQEGLIDKDKFYHFVNYGEFDYDFIEDIPQRDIRLEGYLYPSTYEFAPGDEDGIINEMLMQFDKMYAKYEDRATEMGMTMDEVITLASIIEREALGDEDRKLVSSVFHNRLESDQYPYLQSCATVQYVLKERKPVLTLDDTKIDSPYNTYINEGLPIGPIASPGEEAVEAALYPEESEYLFFVLGSDGKHHFSETYQEHMQNKNN